MDHSPSPAVEARARAARPPLLLLVAVSALQPFALNVLAPSTPGLARALQTDYATVQLTLTLYLAAVAVTQLVVGPISDRIGRRPCILAGLALFLAGSLIGALADGIGTLLTARIVQAIGGGTCFALSRAIVRDTASKDEGASMIGYITMVMIVSPMVAPIAGGALDVAFGWRSVFLACLALGVAVAVAALMLLRETAPSVIGGGSRSETLGEILATFPALIQDRTFLGTTLAVSTLTAAFFVFVAGAPFVVVNAMGRPPSTYGFYFLLNAGGYMVGNFVSGRYGRGIGSERLARMGFDLSLVAVVVTFALTFLIEPWTPIALFLPLAVYGIGNGLAIPGATASALSVRPDLAGTSAGLIGALQLGIGALASAATGVLVPLWPPALVALMLGLTVVGWATLRASQRG